VAVWLQGAEMEGAGEIIAPSSRRKERTQALSSLRFLVPAHGKRCLASEFLVPGPPPKAMAGVLDPRPHEKSAR